MGNKGDLAGRDTRIYTSSAKRVINNMIEQSVFSPDYSGRGLVIPKDTLRKGYIFVIDLIGIFTTTAGASSINKVYFGNTLVFTQPATYSFNRTDYFIRTKLYMGIREIGVNGSLIMQGQTEVQNDTQGGSSTAPFNMNAPVTINTTVDNKIDSLFTWLSANQSLTVSMGIINKM